MLFNILLFLQQFKIFFAVFVGVVEISGPNILMMRGGMMFGEIISLVETSFFPHDMKLALSNTISDPIKSHVNGFGTVFV